MCKQCQGGSVCVHQNIKSTCVECGGGSICIHKKERKSCGDCGNGLCEGCQLWIVVTKNKDGKKLCYCNPYGNRRQAYDANRIEGQLAKYLATQYENTYEIGTYPPFTACTDYKKPDIISIVGTTMVITECDERYHANYEQTCEWSKLFQHCQSAMQTEGITHIIFNRWNPHTYIDGDSKKVKVPLADRMSRLRELIDSCLEICLEDDARMLQVNFLYYPNTLAENGYVHQSSEHELETWVNKLLLNVHPKD